MSVQSSPLAVRSGSAPGQSVPHLHLSAVPAWLGEHVDLVLAARVRPIRLRRLFDRSRVPMVLVDDERRYVHVNAPARLAFRLSLSELLQLRIDDLTPRELWPLMEDAWARLIETGRVAGDYVVASPNAPEMKITYHAAAGAPPGLYLIAFAPVGWRHDELLVENDVRPGQAASRLTDRELEILQLAADGYSAPMIARELVLSTATVRTHFANLYGKLQARDRSAAVAKAMRLGLIT